MNCLRCGKEFAKSKKAKFCSNSCRVMYSRTGAEVKPNIEPLIEKEDVKLSDGEIKSLILKESDAMTVREYLSKGYFGGKAVINGGIVTGRKYFDFVKHQQYFILYLGKKYGLKDEVIKELAKSVEPK